MVPVAEVDAASALANGEVTPDAALAGAGEDMPEVRRLVRAPSEDSTEAMLKMMLAFSYANECCEIGLEVNASRL